MYSIKINNETLMTVDFSEVNNTLLTLGPNVDIRTYTDYYSRLDDRRKNTFITDCNYLSMEHVNIKDIIVDFYVIMFKKFCDKYKDFKVYKDGWLLYDPNRG
jgi:hypothetical protein